MRCAVGCSLVGCSLWLGVVACDMRCGVGSRRAADSDFEMLPQQDAFPGKNPRKTPASGNRATRGSGEVGDESKATKSPT
eukprot:1329056-Rhodomonas_salina.3